MKRTGIYAIMTLCIFFCGVCMEKGVFQIQDISTDDREDKLIIVSSENEDQEQEDSIFPPAESAEKIVLELPCEENEALESSRDEFSLEANDFSITDSAEVIWLDQPFDGSVTEKQEWDSSYTGEIYEGDTGYKLYYHEYEDFELYTSNYHFDIKNRTFDEYFIWQITIKTSKYKTAGGVTVGDCMEEVEKVYGVGEKECMPDAGICEFYYSNGMAVCFVMDESGVVHSIRMYETGNYDKTPYFFSGNQEKLPYNALLYTSDSEEIQQSLYMNISREKVFEDGTLYSLYMSLPDAEESWDGSSPEYLSLGWYYVTEHTVYRIFGPEAEGDKRDRKKEAIQIVRDGMYDRCMIVCNEGGTEDAEDENGMHGCVERNGNRRIFHGYCDTVNGRKEYETIVWEKGRGIICYNIER